MNLHPKRESYGFKKSYLDNSGLLHNQKKGASFIKCFVVLARDVFRFELGSVLSNIAICWEVLEDNTEFVQKAFLEEGENK